MNKFEEPKKNGATGAPFGNNNNESISKNNLRSNTAKETPNPSDNQESNSKKYSSLKWWLFPIVSIPFIVILLFSTNISLFNCQEVGYFINQQQSIMSIVPIDLDRSKYSLGQIVHINLSLNNDDFQIEDTYLEINRTHFPSAFTGCYKPFTLSQQDTFALIKLDRTKSNDTFIPNQSGLYVVSTYNNSSQAKAFKTIFEVINPAKSTTFVMLIIAIGFFIALVLLCYTLSIKNKNLNEQKDIEISRGKGSYDKLEEKYKRKILEYIEIAASFRFIFISALVWSIIFSLVFTDVEIGTHSPFGLVIRHNLNPAGDEFDVTKNPLVAWGINIGGNWENNFSSGVVIPIYVFILGLIGGYLRYLHKAASKEKPLLIENDRTTYVEITQKKPLEVKENTSLAFQEITYGEISNIFLAPLLAAVVWFIISQGKPDFNIYGMAAVSFSIGLVTTEIIQIIVTFMKKIVLI